MPDLAQQAFSTDLDAQDAEIDFGSDVRVFPIFDETMALQRGPRIVAEAVARRWLTQKGTLPFHEDDGVDVRAYLNEAFTQSTRVQLATALQAEALKDERVQSIALTLDFNEALSALTIKGVLTLSTGPFRLVLKVTQLTEELLTEQ